MSGRKAQLQDFPANIQEFFKRYSLPIPKKGHWRMTDYRSGHIHGIANIRGVIHATDGILCYIVRDDGELFVAHLDNFIHDKDQDGHAQSAQNTLVASVKETKRAKRIRTEYV